MPYVRIEITDGATYEQKLQLYKETTEMLMRILNKKPEYTFVVIEEVDNKSWGHMGTSVHEIRMAQAAGLPIPAMGQTAGGGKPAAKKAPGKKAPAKKAPAKKAAARAPSAPAKRSAASKRTSRKA
jgi:4-oxalocrotonate tautomerase